MKEDPTLVAVARNKARDMATRRYFGHVTPDSVGPNHLVRAAGFPLPLWWGTSRTENNVESLSAGFQSASAAWNALIESPGHRSHLLADDSFYRDQTAYGIGYYYDQNSPYWHYFVIITAPPRAKSTLTVTSPKQNAVIGGETLSVTGTVGGSELVSALDIRLENASGQGGWTRIAIPGGSGIVGWSSNLTGLRPGPNTIRLRSYATGGNLLAETARTARWIVLKPLTVGTQGNGKVSAGFTGTTMREVGARYTITASPSDGSTLFSHWTGLPEGANVNAARQSFTMTDGLTLTAHFAPNPFFALKGAYQGVSEGQQPFSTGQLRLTLTATGAFTGRLHYGNACHAISGTLNAQGFKNIQIKRPGGGEIGIAITLDVAGQTSKLTAVVNEYGMMTTFTTDLRSTPTEVFPAGRFTLRINPDNSVPVSPRGNGFAAASVGSSGKVRIVGMLADGTPFTSSSILTKTGGIPLYARLFAGLGAVAGNTTIVNTPSSDLDGTVRYFKPERPLDNFYPRAFTTVNKVIGSRYVAPKKGEPLVDFQTTDNRGRLVLSQGNIQTQIVQPLEVESNNTVALETPSYTGLKITMNPITGRFSGTFFHPTAGLRRFSGVVTQKQRSGWGFFLGLDEAGQTQLQAVP